MKYLRCLSLSVLFLCLLGSGTEASDGYSIQALATGSLTAGLTVTQNPFTATTVTTQAHGLGQIPTLVIAYIECLTAELNYNIGDRIYFNHTDTVATAYNFDVAYDSVNIRILSAGSGLRYQNKTVPAGYATLTSVNWKIVAIPYKLN